MFCVSGACVCVCACFRVCVKYKYIYEWMELQQSRLSCGCRWREKRRMAPPFGLRRGSVFEGLSGLTVFVLEKSRRGW